MKKAYIILAFSAAIVVAFGPALAAQAAEFMTPNQQNGGNLTIPASQTHHNLYAASGNTTVDSMTTGDLYATGGVVMVDGAVEQDVAVAGGNVFLNGKVGGNAHVFGGTININSAISGDLVVFGGTVILTREGSVAGDVVALGGTININGPVKGSVRVNGGQVLLDSAVGGPVTVKAGKEMVFGPQADIPGKINYAGAHKPIIKDGAKLGMINQATLPSRQGLRGGVIGFLTLSFLLKLLAWIAAGLVLLKLLRHRTHEVAESIYRSPWLNLGVGLLAAVATPIISFILIAVVLGYYIALVIVLFYLLLMLLAGLIAAIFLGALIVKLLTKKPHLEMDWQAVVIGVAVFSVILFIPVVGWIIDAIILLMAFGALVRHAKKEINGQQH